MKYVLSAISFLIVGLFLATSTVTMTGCSDVLGVGDTIRDTVKLEKLSVPTVDSVEVLAGGDSAKIHYSGSFVDKEKFVGICLLSGITTPITVVKYDSLRNGSAWTGKGFFTIKIVRDGNQSFWIASYNKSADRSQAVPAFVYGREKTSGVQVARFTVSSTNDGIDVDGIPEVKSVEDGIRDDVNPVKYATNSGADIIVEQIGSTGTLCITPIGGAVIFKSDSTQIFTKAQIDDIYAKSYGDTATTLSTYSNIRVYAQGRSVRAGTSLYPIAAGDYFIVITSAKNVARVKIEAATGATSATLAIYQDSGRNAGEPLYKKAL